MVSDRLSRLSLVATLALGSAACGGGMRPYPLREPMWQDTDQRPFAEKPEEYYSPFAWDGANQLVFRPISRFFAVDPEGEAVNVNALDEVPDSAWFHNRMGRYAMSPTDVAKGPCGAPPIDPQGPWTVIGAKPNGANPGFLIKDAGGAGYLLKFDGVVQGTRPTFADVIGTRIYHAAGYHTPCNRITYFDRSILRIAPDAKSENEKGEKIALREADIDKVLDKAVRMGDGRYRANASLFVDGKPLGPFTYQGTRDDDPNDVIDHQNRRELRGAYVFAAWTNHFDSREQNTLDTWIEVEGKGGYIQHYIIDFGDCFGSIWEPPSLGRRIGQSHYLDFGHLVEDWVTLGAISRPWDDARFGPAGKVLGYYDVKHFTADAWRPGYPNPAMSVRTERDAAWGARILAELTNAHVRALVDTGKVHSAVAKRELVRVLIGRRDKLLRRYFAQLSPLAHPEVVRAGAGSQLCVRDLAVYSRITAKSSRTYAARAWQGTEARPLTAPGVRTAGKDRVCAQLPAIAGASEASPRYLIVDIAAGSPGGDDPGPLRVHLYQLGTKAYRVVGVQRPDDDDPPG